MLFLIINLNDSRVITLRYRKWYQWKGKLKTFCITFGSHYITCPQCELPLSRDRHLASL